MSKANKKLTGKTMRLQKQCRIHLSQLDTQLL